MHVVIKTGDRTFLRSDAAADEIGGLHHENRESGARHVVGTHQPIVTAANYDPVEFCLHPFAPVLGTGRARPLMVSAAKGNALPCDLVNPNTPP